MVNEDSTDDDRDHKMPRCAKYATPTAYMKSLPTKSPLKKKIGDHEGYCQLPDHGMQKVVVTVTKKML